MPEKRSTTPPRVNTPGPRRPEITVGEFAAIVAREQSRRRRSLSRLGGLGRWRRWA